MVYIVQMGENGPIKIGYSEYPIQRVNSFAGSWPYAPIVIRFMQGERDKERELHARFRKYRLNGEWFSPAPEILALANPKDKFKFDDQREITLQAERRIKVKPKPKKLRLTHEQRRKRREQIAKLVLNGDSPGAVAKRFRLSEGSVKGFCKEHGVKLPRKKWTRKNGRTNN